MTPEGPRQSQSALRFKKLSTQTFEAHCTFVVLGNPNIIQVYLNKGNIYEENLRVEYK